MSYHLDSAEERYRLNPVSFRIPTRATRESLRVGCFAKLLFRSGDDGERMWVQVAQILGSGSSVRYRGPLNTKPIRLPLEEGTEVEFGPEHIADIEWSSHE